MKLTDKDIEWIRHKLREEFDTPKEIHQLDEYGQIIERAIRFEFFDLAAEMKLDLPFTKTYNPYQ